MKRIVTIITIILATSLSASAQVPKPPTGANRDTKGRTNGNIAVRQGAVKGPIGTGTALLLSLGAGAVAYKAKKNKRKE